MYEAFYGFKEKPFSMLPDPGFLYLSKKHQTALTLLEYGLLNKAGFCVISGEPGAGKTTILRAMLGRVDDDVTVGLITNTHQSFGGLLDWILSVYDLHQPNLTHVEMHQIFMDYLIGEYAKNRSVLLIVDEAQNMNADSLEELRMLSNVNSEKDQLLQIVLVGQPALKDLLRKPELMQFAQRIAVDYHLAPLDLEETCGYIQHRLVVAGAKKNVFTPAACERIYNYSGGTPRLINLLCDTVLVFGFADQVDVIDVNLVEEMVHERMRDSVVPIVNKDSVREDNAEAIAKLEENFPWIGCGDEPEATEELMQEDGAEHEGGADNELELETQDVQETLAAKGVLLGKAESETDSPVIETEELNQSVTGASEPDIQEGQEVSLASDDVSSRLTGRSVPPEAILAETKASITTSQMYKFGAAVIVVVLIIIVLAVVYSNKNMIKSVETEGESELLKQKESQLQREAAQKVVEVERLAREAVIKLAIEEAAVKEKLKKELAELEKIKKDRAKKEKDALDANKKKEKELAKKKRAEKKRAEQQRITKEKQRKARDAEYEKKRKKRKAALLKEENRLKAEKEAIRLEQERLAAEKEAHAAKLAASEKSLQENEKAASQSAKQSDGWIGGKNASVEKKSAGCSGPTARFKSRCR